MHVAQPLLDHHKRLRHRSHHDKENKLQRADSTQLERHRSHRESRVSSVSSKPFVDGQKKKKSSGGIVFRNNRRQPFLHEVYIELIRHPPVLATGLMIAALGITVVLFWILYMPIQDSFVHETDPSLPVGRLDLLLFSLGTTTTLGMSLVRPITSFALLIANLQALSVQVLLVFLTGVVFTRLTQPQPDIRAAACAVLGTFGGKKSLIIRYVFNNPKVFLDVRMGVTYKRHVTLDNGSRFYKYDNLELMRNEAVRVRVAQTVVHFIDEDSPLFQKSILDLQEEKAAFDISIFGSEAFSMQPIYYVKSFETSKGEVRVGRYKDMIYTDGNGQRVIDHAFLDIVEPLDEKEDNDDETIRKDTKKTDESTQKKND
mmetsp:Transcript_21522/g.32028  ORF Transcript_21522/g.32028 Transcript_21522/m.32028 type:complete len:372 (+) Transcript_21522:109-1224(+)